MKVEAYIRELFGKDAKLVSTGDIGGLDELKGFGYGKPLKIEVEIGGVKKGFVLSTMRGDSFGHEHMEDRARVLMEQYHTFNSLPEHVKSVDIGYFTADGAMKSVRDANEYFLLMEEVEGSEYVLDLNRISRRGELEDLDRERAYALSSYLARIHAIKPEKGMESLYTRRIRELVGHGECIMGLTDSYPPNLEFISWKELEIIEKGAVRWRWRIKDRCERLCAVHGDFHPWNILFREGTSFTMLDRSRGAWGEAADDLSSITINYLFFALTQRGSFDGAFKELFDIFWENYLEKTEDYDILEFIPPFYLFRGLVVASPIWYPNLDPEVRLKLFNFIKSMASIDRFDPMHVENYLREP
ncbi:MAG: aminoglycoside phosphotransferase [Candidatus Syntrophoarchaeum caldarius]|uniref:Aminoglycoside phosphotransferase n=1 Tax=Candidatus Syntropharchaeum caldarium TaxID=1838285 RepID=A0A1F2P7S9_9EURY|nr:MAG: aminoglycoside phosphotransferase [Candidatus Syntrophoarchaeum caldarius]